ncbi:unnamed protein product, partial [Ectocarpus sp. 12 AP-2014]
LRLAAHHRPGFEERGPGTGDNRSCRRCRGERHHSRPQIPPADGNLRRGRGQGTLS